MQRLLLSALLASSLASHSTDILFKDVTVEAGLLTPLQGMMGHAAAWGDWNKDGLVDLFVGGFCDRPDSEYFPAKGPVSPKLFRNMGNSRFEPYQSDAFSFCGRTSGAIFADLNQDGFSELFISNNAKIPGAGVAQALAKRINLRSMLLQNRNGKFSNVSGSSGIPDTLMTARSIAVLDYNLDGLPDLFIVEDKFESKRNPSSVLLRNLGRLQFRVANAEAGLPDNVYGLGVAVSDVNEDGRADIFVSHSNRMFFSQGNRFHESLSVNQQLAWLPLDGEDWPSGAAFADLNRDGRLDLVLSIHHKPARNRVFLNQGIHGGVPYWNDVTSKVGLPPSFPEKCPHVEIQDFDNDGWPDIYFSAAWKNGNELIPLIYRNRGLQEDGLPLFELARKGEGNIVYFPAGPSADFDRDGRVDLFLANWFRGESCHLLKNTTRGGNWIQIEAPIGSGIKVTFKKQLIGYQQVQIGYGYSSGQSPVCHFGVGNLTSLDMEVRLPGGSIKKRSTPVNRQVKVSE